MTTLVLDIETIGQREEEVPERALDYLKRGLERDRPAPEELDRRYEELVSRFGLDPTTGRIVVVGIVDADSEAEHVFAASSEPELLTQFWSFIAETSPERIVTFNGKRFDVPYLNVRSAIHGLTPPATLDAEPGSRHSHFDVREVLESGDRRRRGGLDYFCAVFGIPSPKIEMAGADVAAAHEQGRLDDIIRYCLADCRATLALYQRLAPFYP